LPADRLSPLQRDLLEAFFLHESRFHLTGGAALAGYYLGHRETADLDLFTSIGVIEEGEAALRAAARDVGASVEHVQTAPEFRRRLVRRARESVIVDLVVDTTPQGPQPKRHFGDVRVDPPQEILANKLCTLLSRAELRDLVDVLALERAGFRAEDALPLANCKDGGLTPAQLAWVLSQVTVGDDAAIPGDVSPADLQAFLADLIARLTRLSFPR
jgi:hypothetical protein